MVERMKRSYHIDWFPEDGAQYPVRVFLYKDEVMVTLDTSGGFPSQERIPSGNEQGAAD